jgi:hypothetical protein
LIQAALPCFALSDDPLAVRENDDYVEFGDYVSSAKFEQLYTRICAEHRVVT